MFRRIVTGITAGVATCAVLGLVGGCLTRPVEATNPITKTNFITSIATGTIDKVDILFDIDNSASMGDKEAYLAKAIPDLLTRLVQPNCIDPNTMAITGQASLSGTCTGASQAEFPPVHNMHIGIVSSSLGARLGDSCDPGAQQMTPQGNISRHNDDQAHLLNRTANPMTQFTNYTEGKLGDAPDPDDFLDWFPPQTVNGANAGNSPTGPTPISTTSGTGSVLNSDFEQLVVGVHEFGCGIESQLESWYRFLIQPDPYASLGKDKSGQFAQWVGVDTTILAQRADFLRPDSLVAVLVLTDENDSEVDVRSFGGTAWNFMTSSTGAAPFYPPHGTQICQMNPNDPTCTSCAFGKSSPTIANDPACKANGGKYTALTDWGSDLNLRHVHEKQKYGVSVQFPIQRYVVGLTSPRVPNRDTEYPSGAQSYQGLVPGNLNCTNPLYAATLPRPPATGTWAPTADEMCNLPPGTRKPSLVFYAHIGGVPHQLLQVDPTNPDSPQKTTLTAADWQLILGKNAETYDYTGIDPHMVESFNQRTMVPMPTTGGFPVADQTQPEGRDPIAGREWETDSTSPMHQGLRVDREYACIFKLETPRDCSDAAIKADPTLSDSCDCASPDPGVGGGAFTHSEVPAVCNDANPNQQDSAKAYPTIRELELAHLLGQIPGANEGIISSLCPIHTTDMSPDHTTDQLYGYRPAMNAIISRLASALSNQCLPTRLVIDPTTKQVPCLVLGTFPAPAGKNNVPTDCKSVQGSAYTDPDPSVIKEFKTDQHAQWARTGSVGPDPSLNLTCEVVQQPPNVPCNTNNTNGWCYYENNGTVTNKCAQEIRFSKTALTSGVVTSLQCLESSASVLDDGAAPATPVVTPASDAGSGGD